MKKYFIFFCIAWSIFIAHAILVKHAIYGDGNGYYSYTQALYFDKSLDFTKIYNHLSNFQGKDYEFSRIFWDRSFNPYSIGTGIIWMPSMLFTSIFSSDRFDLIHELGPGLTGIICMIAGLYFLEKYLKNRFSEKTVFWTILTLFFGSNVFYYTALEPALSHQPAFLIVSLLLYLSDRRKINLFITGILCGLLAAIRIGDVILLIPILYNLKKYKWKLLHLLAGAILAVSPQLINQNIQFGSLLTNPYINGANGHWDIKLVNVFNVLFSLKRGFVTWTPLFAFAIYGLIKERKFLILSTVFVFFLVVSFWPGGLSAGFGIRLLFSAIPYFSIGIAKIISMMNKENKFRYFSLNSLYNFSLIFAFYFLGLKRLP